MTGQLGFYLSTGGARPAKRPATAKAGTATAGLQVSGQVPPADRAARLIAAPMAPKMAAEPSGRSSLRHLIVITGLLVVAGGKIILGGGPTGPAGARHSGGHTQPRQDDGLEQYPDAEKHQQPYQIHSPPSFSA